MTASRSATSSPYAAKHNQANGENNRDGRDENFSWNCGVEGYSDGSRRSSSAAAATCAGCLPRSSSRAARRC